MTDRYKKRELAAQMLNSGQKPATRCIHVEQSHIRRRATRCKAHGIVVLKDFKKPLITNIYDISTRGVSFWQNNRKKLTEDTFNMDILIFDVQTGFEYLISQLEGQVIYTDKLVRHPVTDTLVRRCGLKFIHKNSASRTIVERCCSMLFNQCQTCRLAM